jgi:hypothetical protein
MQFLPWKASLVYAESRGFPSLQLLRWCLGTDAVQATVSVLCQIIFLTSSSSEGGETNNDNTSAQEKALFAMNITSAVLGSISGLLTLCLRDSLLSRLEGSTYSSNSSSSGEGVIITPNTPIRGVIVTPSSSSSSGEDKWRMEGRNNANITLNQHRQPHDNLAAAAGRKKGREEEPEPAPFGIDYSVYSGSASAELEMADVVNPMMMMTTTTRVGAAAATVAAGNKLSARTDDDDDDDDGDVRSQVSKLSAETVQLERELDEALAQTSRIECENARLEEDNARLESESERDQRAAELKQNDMITATNDV